MTLVGCLRSTRKRNLLKKIGMIYCSMQLLVRHRTIFVEDKFFNKSLMFLVVPNLYFKRLNFNECLSQILAIPATGIKKSKDLFLKIKFFSVIFCYFRPFVLRSSLHFSAIHVCLDYLKKFCFFSCM